MSEKPDISRTALPLQRHGQSSVRSRVPLRLGLAGGGTDLASYYQSYGGAVLNATIDRYAYAHLRLRNDQKVVFKADDLQRCDEFLCGEDFNIREGLVLHRAVYSWVVKNYLNHQPVALTLATTIDVPVGSGLGASSALTVALIEAFVKVFNLPLGPYDVAAAAYEIERKDIGLLGGKQDQYAAAFGGVNFIEFLQNDRTIVNPLRVHRDTLLEWEASLVICFSGQSRESATIISQQVESLGGPKAPAMDAMHDIKSFAVEMKNLFLEGRVKEAAIILQKSWLAKKQTSKAISNQAIDRLMEIALCNGAWGGKVSGAGGGGFIMLFADPEHRYRLIESLNEAGGQASAVRLTFVGPETWVVNDE